MIQMPYTMDPQVAKKLLKVGEAFHIPGPFFSYEEICQGNVNHTYKVNYIRDDGTGMARIKPYLVQKVNTYAFRNPIQLMENIDKVTEYIHAKRPNETCLHFHHTETDGERKTYLMDEDGFWRICNYVPSVTYDTCDDIRVVRSAGEAFGDFFDFEGRTVLQAATVTAGLTLLHQNSKMVAVAAGERKAEAIIAATRHERHDHLITDEGAAKRIAAMLERPASR